MQLSAILSRIDERRTALGLSDQALSLKSGLSKDLMRNWRRRSAANSQASGANMTSLGSIAQALEVPLQWLLTGGDIALQEHASGDEDALDLRIHDGRVFISANLGREGLARLRKSLDGIAALIEAS